MDKKILVATIYTGFNYGSSLQAVAMKSVISKLKFIPNVVAYKSFLSKGRDIRLKKIIIMLWRTILRPTLLKKSFIIYSRSIDKPIDDITRKLFISFNYEYIKPSLCTERVLKQKAESVVACICGSDQIWNSEAVYVSPLFYLRFAPKGKRIAYAPSLGKEFIPSYNKKILHKYISEIPFVSVREIQGAKVLHDLIGLDVPVVLDPTLLISHNEWKQYINDSPIVKEKYILCYFLDEPSAYIIDYINIEYKDYIKIAILYNFAKYG